MSIAAVLALRAATTMAFDGKGIKVRVGVHHVIKELAAMKLGGGHVVLFGTLTSTTTVFKIDANFEAAVDGLETSVL